jgi:hypothetical protein
MQSNSIESLENIDQLLSGLRILAESSFPRECGYCGKRYESAEQFLEQTKGTYTSPSGLTESVDDDDHPTVEAYRNCSCGSTLVEVFDNRRGNTQEDCLRRKKFSEVLETLVAMGVERSIARNELLAVIRGETSELLENYIR